MAREATITQEQVNAAADAIRATGTKPTARAVRDALGTGSMATVLKFLQVWQSGQARPAAQDVTLPPALVRGLVDFIGQEVSAARAGLEADLAAQQQSQADLIAESERQNTTIESQAEMLDQVYGEKAELQGKLGLLEVDLAAARDEAARERQAAEVARTELAKAQLRLEALPRIEAEVERLRAELFQATEGLHAARQEAAVLSAKHAAATDRADSVCAMAEREEKEFEASRAIFVQELRQAQAERDEARKAAAEAREQAAEFKGEMAALKNQPRFQVKKKPHAAMDDA